MKILEDFIFGESFLRFFIALSFFGGVVSNILFFFYETQISYIKDLEATLHRNLDLIRVWNKI